jgi:RNA polymerase sigma-70 factor, ECF subfamily
VPRRVTISKNLHPSTQDEAQALYANLVLDAKSGDADAMERLLLRVQGVAYRVSLLVCGHHQDAEDVMQEALLSTYQHVNQIDDPRAFRTWLYMTVRNACLMRRRRRVGEPARPVSIEQGDSRDKEARPIDVEDPSRSADQQIMDTWLGARLRRALAALPRDYRVVVVLREIEGLSTRDVASITGVSESNVKTRLHRARAMLRRDLDNVSREAS